LPVPTSLYLATALGDSERVEEALARGAKDADRAFEPFLQTILESRSDWRRGGIFSATCVSALCALEQATSDLELGRTRRAVIVAFDALSRTMHAGFAALRALSPSGECRPFDRRHDGIVLGESVCALVFERHEGMDADSVSDKMPRVLASRLFSDSFHLTSPDPSGRAMAEAIRRALDDASLEPSQLGGALLTAIGSPLYDTMLERALSEALGDEIASRLPVSSWETATGHALAATGALAIAMAARAVSSGQLLPLAQIKERVRGCTLDLVTEAPRPLSRPRILALVVGFGGQNGAVVVGTADT
jgi:3-oxoacyl-(acyl-carrier-protein) synthase